MKTIHETRYASSPGEVRQMDTARLRESFLIDTLFTPESVQWVYSHYDRFMTGGAMPCNETLKLEPVDVLKAGFFLERRELGIINVGGPGIVQAGTENISLGYKEALYVGRGCPELSFRSENPADPARFYLNSTPAHREFPLKKVSRQEAEVVTLGTMETANHRTINKLLVNSVVPTCQLQMGMTELKPGSVWNTMPAHTHDRRMEVYFYFEVPGGQSVCHFMGEPQETRHIWIQDRQAVISPPWSIHAGAGTSNYTFIWGMAGENLDYDDMDKCAITALR